MSESPKDRLRFGERMALALGPIPIRLLLAVTFIWAGSGKFFAQGEYAGSQALALYEMGVIVGPAGTVPDPAPQEPGVEGGLEGGQEGGQEGTGETDPTQGIGEGGRVGLVEPDAASGAIRLVSQDETAAKYTAADFDEPIEMMNLYGVAVMLYQGAHPGYEEGTSKPRRSLVPAWAASGQRPVVLAWVVGLTELIGGVLVLVGLLTRVSALGLCGAMAVAMWLTVFGPAIQDGGAFLGFLPTYGVFSSEWKDSLWLLALLGASGSLFLSGAGSLSLHAFLFGSRAENDEDDHEEE